MIDYSHIMFKEKKKVWKRNEDTEFFVIIIQSLRKKN